MIIRTAAEGVDEETLAADVESLLALWREIEHDAELQAAPCLLYKDRGLLGWVLRDEVHGSVDEIILDSAEEMWHVILIHVLCDVLKEVSKNVEELKELESIKEGIESS